MNVEGMEIAINYGHNLALRYLFDKANIAIFNGARHHFKMLPQPKYTQGSKLPSFVFKKGLSDCFMIRESKSASIQIWR